MYKSLILVVVGVGFFSLSCRSGFSQEYDIDKTSPDGLYRVRVEVRAEKAEDGHHAEKLNFRFFKGAETVYTYEEELSNEYEPSFRDTRPVIEWLENNVLRMGETRTDQPFYDYLIVRNNTDEHLKYVDVSYGKFETFWIFDLEPKGQVTLQASPRFKPDHTSNYFLGYGGITNTGKKFEGTLDRKQRTSPTDGPLKFDIGINPKDLQ